MWRKTLNQKGMLLIEVLFALAILFIVVFSFSKLLSFSYSSIHSAGHKSEALYKAQQKMEKAIADTSYVDSEVTRSNNIPITITSTNYGVITFYGSQIEVAKQYTESNGIDRTIVLFCYIPD